MLHHCNQHSTFVSHFLKSFSHLYFEEALPQLDQVSCGETVAIQEIKLVQKKNKKIKKHRNGSKLEQMK